MPLKPLRFSDVCDLLHNLEKIEQRLDPPSRNERRRATRAVIDAWFKKFRTTVDAPSANGVALLSTLFPERRADRVYGLKEPLLSKLIPRCLSFTVAKTKQVQEYLQPGYGDLAECLERLLRVHDAEKGHSHYVSIDAVHSALESLAALSRFSSPEMRLRSTQETRDQILKPILLKMRSYEVKWFVRLILKNYSPVVLDERHVIATYHFLLPGLLQLQDSFEAAVALLKEPLRTFHANPDAVSQRLFKQQAAKLVRPRIGMKVGRPEFHKARSMQHCLKMADKKRWVVERKYDGEYCEIHVDLSREPQRQIKIFSKSSKDSTEDRSRIHQTIRDCLRLGTSSCAFKQQCILLGELVVYDDELEDILPFHKIRKHVSRSGRFLGTEKDSQTSLHEHLMIIFFDILLVDDDVILTKPHNERREALHRLISKIDGRAATSEWKLIDFSTRGADVALVQQFTASIQLKHEGLLLKPADAPYFSLMDDEPGNWHSGFIKLKKDYMQGLGEECDVADLVVVGASYKPRQARRSAVRGLQWTTFHLGCLTNPDHVRFGRMPVFKVVGSIGEDHCIPPPELQALNNIVKFNSVPMERSGNALKNPTNFDLILDSSPDSRMGAILTQPTIAEVLGSGYEKPPNKDFFMLRHPRILKVHLDRTWNDAVTVNSLAGMAETAMVEPVEGESQEMMRLMAKFERKMIRKADRGELRSSFTPGSAKTKTPGSPITRSTVSPRSALAAKSYAANRAAVPSSSPTNPPSHLSSSPLRKRVSPPVFVRVDTCERLPEAAASSARQNITRARAAASSNLPTPPTSSACDVENQRPPPSKPSKAGPTTSTNRKRPATEEQEQRVCHPHKRARNQRGDKPHGTHVDDSDLSKAAQQDRPVKARHPFSDITNTSNQHCTSPISSSSKMADYSPQSPRKPATADNTSPALPGVSSPLEQSGERRRNRESLPRESRNRLDGGPMPSESDAHGDISTQPARSELDENFGLCCHFPESCMWRNSIFYLSPCIFGQYYVSENLIPEHGRFVTSNLAHWARENSPVNPNANYVPESQAYAGTKKIILVERNRHEQSMKVVDEVVRLGVRERIDFLDWRALERSSMEEKCTESRGPTSWMQKDIAQESFFGRSWWDAEERKVQFSTFNIYDNWSWNAQEI